MDSYGLIVYISTTNWINYNNKISPIAAFLLYRRIYLLYVSEGLPQISSKKDVPCKNPQVRTNKKNICKIYKMITFKRYDKLVLKTNMRTEKRKTALSRVRWKEQLWLSESYKAPLLKQTPWKVELVHWIYRNKQPTNIISWKRSRICLYRFTNYINFYDK